MKRFHYWVCLVVAALAAGACETDRPSTHEASSPATSQGESGERGASDRGFGWRDILAGSVDDAEHWLGPTSGCKPARALRKWNQDPYPGAPVERGPGARDACRFPEGRDGDFDAPYVVEAVLFHEGRATALRMKPEGELPMDADIHAHFDLPEFPVVTRRNPEFDGARGVVRHRAKQISDNDTTPFGFNVVPRPDAPQKVAHVDVFNAVWPRLVDRAAIKGPVPGVDKVMVPTTRETLDVFELRDHGYVEVKPSTVRIRSFPNYPEAPVRTVDTGPDEWLNLEWPAEQAEATRQRFRRVHEQLDTLRERRETLEKKRRPDLPDSGAGRSPATKGPKLEGRPRPAEKKEKEDREKGYVLAVALDIGAPYGHAGDIIERLQRAGYDKLKLIGRRVEALDTEAAADPLNWSLAAVNVLATPEARPTIGYGRSRRRTPVLEIRDDGFDLRTSDGLIAPVDGCPDDGPTVCLRDRGADVPELASRVVELRKANQEDDVRETLAELFDAYDWSGLYRELVELRKGRKKQVLAFRSAPPLPWGVTARAIEVARYYRTVQATDDKTCTDELSSSQIFTADPCMKEAYRRTVPARLFDDVLLGPPLKSGKAQ